MIHPNKEKDLEERMRALGIIEEDLIEKFVLSSGRGGQNIQKTSSCVYLKHIPTGIEIKCQKERSQHLNRYHARKLLCAEIEARVLRIKTEKQHLREKIRRQKRRRSRKTQAKVLHDKKQRGAIKTLRSPPQE